MKKHKNTYFYYIKYLITNFKAPLIVIPILSFLCLALTTSTIILTKCIVENISTNDITTIDLSYILLIILAIAFVYLFSTASNSFLAVISLKLAVKINYKIKKDLMNRMEVFSISFFHNNNAGNLVSYFSNDADTISQNINTIYCSLCSISFSLLLFGTIITIYNPVISFFIIIHFLFAIIIVTFYLKYSQKYFDEQQNDLALLTDHAEEFCYGLDVIKTSHNKQKVINLLYSQIDKLSKSSHNSLFKGKLIYPAIKFVYYICYLALLVGLCIVVIDKDISIGEITIYIQILTIIFDQLFRIINISTRIQNLLAAIKRLKLFIDYDEYELQVNNIDDSSINCSSDNYKKYIEFKNVIFSYNKGQAILNDLSFSINKHSKVAIIGQTGCGKTTCTHLLTKIYAPDNGEIFFKGRNLNSINTSDFRNKISFVTQNVWLFKGTIFDNIRFGKEYVKISDVVLASKKAHVHNLIMSLPGNYYYELSEDMSNISAGFKQLISIARAILQDREIIIFDEATSSIDVAIEKKINKTIYTAFPDKTMIMIAHKYTTIQQCDQIFYLKNGSIEESGTHDELLKKSKYYKAMYESQKMNEYQIAAENLLL